MKHHKSIFMTLAFLLAYSVVHSQNPYSISADTNSTEDSLFFYVDVYDDIKGIGAKLLLDRLPSEYLIEKLESDESWEKNKAMAIFQFSYDPGLVEDLIRFLNDKEPIMTQGIIKALVSINSSTAIPALLDLLKAGQLDFETTISLLYALREIPDKRSISALKQFAEKNTGTAKGKLILIEEANNIKYLLEQYFADPSSRNEVLENGLKHISTYNWALRMIEKEQDPEFWLPVLRKLKPTRKYRDALFVRKLLGETEYTEEERAILNLK